MESPRTVEELAAYPPLTAFLVHLGARGEQLEDLRQEVLLKVLRLGLVERYDPARKASFDTYLYHVVSRVVFTARTMRFKRLETCPVQWEPVTDRLRLDNPEAALVTRIYLSQAAQRIPPAERQTLHQLVQGESVTAPETRRLRRALQEVDGGSPRVSQ